MGTLILSLLTLVSFKEIAELQRVYNKSRMLQDSIPTKALPTGLKNIAISKSLWQLSTVFIHIASQNVHIYFKLIFV